MFGLAKNGEILFPDDIDNRSFFSDIGLQDKSKLTDHNKLMRNRAYRRASAYAEETGHEYYGAYLFNALEGRVKRIGEYLLNDDTDSIRPYYQGEEPSEDLYNNLTWISSTQI